MANQVMVMNDLIYPVSRKVDQLDIYHGVTVRDPYQWLESETDAGRRVWIAAQNALTADFVGQIPERCELRCRFDQLLSYSRYYDLFQRGPYIFFKRNAGLENQLVLYVQRGLLGTPQILVDPNVLPPDGGIRLGAVALSGDARYLAYGLSEGGVEWEEYFVKDMDTGEELPDRLRWVKASTIAWRGDGFYYSRYRTPDDVTRALSTRTENHQVWYHHVGTDQSADVLVYEDPDHPLRLNFVQTTEDERFVVLTLSDRGTTTAGHALWVLDTATQHQTFRPLVPTFDSEFQLVGSQDDSLLLVTDRNAPNRRLVLIHPSNPDDRAWTEVIPERREPLEIVTAIGGMLFAVYRSDCCHRLCVFDGNGRLDNEIPLPAKGLARVYRGQQQDVEAFWSFMSFTTPPTIYRYDIVRQTSSVFQEPSSQFDADEYETKQVFYASKDGTRIPMFIVHRRDLELNGLHPALLQGYGGNGFSMGPFFDPLLIPLLERGIVFAVACLRGGGEFGQDWHRAGMGGHKQNVFDDCIAAIEWLQLNGYTRCDRTALIGTSNGGLLVAAVMVQRPDLLQVALPGAPITDMLRFQQFTLGWAWTPEYGSSDDPSMFPTLLAYSPLHNIREGVNYPATLVTTYEDDDIVVPAHSFKFVATLQELGMGDHPYLIRIEHKSGHGSVSLPKELDERADIYAFLLANMPGVLGLG